MGGKKKEKREKKRKKKRKASYENILTGKLSLKGSSLPIRGESKRSEGKRKKKKYEEEFKKFYEEQKQKKDENLQKLPDLRTASEKQSDLVFEQRQETFIGNSIRMTHRQKIEKFNDYLGKLSEHYDIPRVGPG